MPATDRSELVEKITRLVLAELSGGPAAGPQAAAAALHAYAADPRSTAGRPGFRRIR